MGELKGLYISPDLHRKIKALAAARGLTVREMVELLLEDELEGTDDAGNDGQDQPQDRPGIQRRSRRDPSGPGEGR